jgi:cyclase
MGLAFRIIPVILHEGMRMVKGKRFAKDRTVGIASQAVKIHQARGVDELLILDVRVKPISEGVDVAHVKLLADACFSPLTVGGGLRSIHDVRAALNAGADKVAIGTAWMRRPNRIRRAIDSIGSQAFVAIINYSDGVLPDRALNQHVWVQRSGVLHAARFVEDLGFGEIVLNNADADGMMCGYDLDTIENVASRVNVPVIACGGCAGPDDMKAVHDVGAAGAAAGALFQFTDWTPKSCAMQLHNAEVEVRIHE